MASSKLGGTVNDIALLTLRSPYLTVGVDPARGLSITSVVGVDGDEWLFFDPARGPRQVAAGTAYDDVWRGGFEELFPCDAPGRFDGRELPDHGELWREPFEVVQQDAMHIFGRRACDSVPATVEKRIALMTDRPVARIAYRVTNTSDVVLRFLFKLHAAMRVEAGDELLLAGGTVTAVAPGFGPLADAAPLAWPARRTHTGEALDLSRVRASDEGFREFVYVSDLPAGWCGVRRRRTGSKFRLRYPRDVFSHCWLFITYGGWRGYHTVVLEPCTNWPKDLAAAAQRGRCASLGPGEWLNATIELSVEPAHER